MRRLAFLMAVAGLANGGPASAQGDPVSVAATVAMVGEVVENIGGQCVEVTSLMGAGVDPHLYRASASDVRTLQTADVIFYSGYALEGQLGEVLERFAERKPTVALAQASIDRAELIAVQDAYGIDPHVWMDVALWSRIVPQIAETLAEIDPDCTELYGANAQSYGGQLAALHGWIAAAVSSIPAEQRTLVTAHDAFAYYGRAYGIEVAGIQGLSTQAEASVADIRDTARQVADAKVPAMFVESTINGRTVQAVIDASRELGHAVAVGGELYSDAMGDADTMGGTYIGMMYENTVTIVEALGGDVPPLPDALEDWAERWNVAGG